MLQPIRTPARTDGQTLNDNYIIQKVSNGEFQDLNAFKSMFKSVWIKVANGGNIASITVRDHSKHLGGYQMKGKRLTECYPTIKQVICGMMSITRSANYLQLFKASDDFRQSILPTNRKQKTAAKAAIF